MLVYIFIFLGEIFCFFAYSLLGGIMFFHGELIPVELIRRIILREIFGQKKGSVPIGGLHRHQVTGRISIFSTLEHCDEHLRFYHDEVERLMPRLTPERCRLKWISKRESLVLFGENFLLAAHSTFRWGFCGTVDEYVPKIVAHLPETCVLDSEEKKVCTYGLIERGILLPLGKSQADALYDAGIISASERSVLGETFPLEKRMSFQGGINWGE